MAARPRQHSTSPSGATRNLRDELRPRPRRAGATDAARRAAPLPDAIGPAERLRLVEQAAPGSAASLRCDALHRLAEAEWPVRERRGLLMLLLHAAMSPSPAVRFAALDALARVAARYPRLRARAVALLERWSRAPCRATAIHAARLLDADAARRGADAN